MQSIGKLLERHRNTFLIVLAAATFIVSARVQEGDATRETVSIPVVATANETNPVAVFLAQRNASSAADMAALEAIVSREDVDASTRQAAAQQLSELVAARQAQSAIEGALVGSSLYPCVAVVSVGTVTVVTGKSAVTDRDSALVLSLAAQYAGADAADVSIITAN